jgi:hypothetical protein
MSGAQPSHGPASSAPGGMPSGKGDVRGSAGKRRSPGRKSRPPLRYGRTLMVDHRPERRISTFQDTSGNQSTATTITLVIPTESNPRTSTFRAGPPPPLSGRPFRNIAPFIPKPLFSWPARRSCVGSKCIMSFTISSWLCGVHSFRATLTPLPSLVLIRTSGIGQTLRCDREVV